MQLIQTKPNRGLPNGKVVFGLATSHSRNLTKQKLKWQVRWVDQTQYPMIVVASLSAVPQSCRTPLLKFRLETLAENQVENQTKIRTSGEKCKLEVRSFTSLQMFHTHTHAPLPRGFFMEITNGERLLSVP